ncbi:MAG: hypothetical protein NTW96_11585, partial [Planctomycetia bacterium]|nr:hypothetical protein [Planctomycetia bacterium]
SLAATIGGAGDARAQIIFNGINPGDISTRSIDPDPSRRAPIETETKASKPYEPMPHYHNRNDLPDRIELGTLSQPDIRPDHIRPDRITWSLITQEDIAPQRLSAKPLMPAMSPGERMTETPRLAAPQWSFDQQLRGEPKPAEQFGSSIYLPVPDYDRNRPSPVLAERQEEEAAFRPSRATHPISW